MISYLSANSETLLLRSYRVRSHEVSHTVILAMIEAAVKQEVHDSLIE